MSKLDDKFLPFQSCVGNPEDGFITVDKKEQAFLLDTAFNAFPETWQDIASDYIERNPEFLDNHGLVMPQSDEDDFDPMEILIMQIITRRDVLKDLRESLTQEGHNHSILENLLKHPTMQNRIRSGETFPQSNPHAFDAE